MADLYPGNIQLFSYKRGPLADCGWAGLRSVRTLAPTLCILLLLLAAGGPAARAQDRSELANRSGQPWTLALVEGTRPAQGTLTVLDKFSGTTLGTLGKVGDAVPLPAQGRFVLIFNRKDGDLYRDFILKDFRGYYAEYVACVEFRSSPRISVQLRSQHVGPSLDHADPDSIEQFINDAIVIERDNIIIHPNCLELDGRFAQSLVN